MNKWWILTKALVKGSDAFGAGARKNKKRSTLISKGLDKSKRIFFAFLAIAYVSVIFGIQGWTLAEQLLSMGLQVQNPEIEPVMLAALRAGIGQLYLPGFYAAGNRLFLCRRYLLFCQRSGYLAALAA